MKERLTRILSILMVCVLFLGTGIEMAPVFAETEGVTPAVTEEPAAGEETTEPVTEPAKEEPAKQKVKPLAKVSEKEIRYVFNHSIFIGNSVMKNKRTYFKKEGNKRYGKPMFLAYSRYSSQVDRKRTKIYMLEYKGKRTRAKDAIRRSKKKYAFISLGQNDMMTTVYDGYVSYTRYLAEIHKANPKVVLFVEATTPMRNPRKRLTQARINKLNKWIEAYCRSKDWVWFIDTATPLKDHKGFLKKKYSLDNYTHMNRTGARHWTKLDHAYIKKYLSYKKAGRLKELEPVKKMPKIKRSVQKKYIKKWDSKKKVMYYNDGTKVYGTVFYKGKFYVFPGRGKYSAKKTKKLRAAVKKYKSVKPLLKILGKPSKKSYEPSCWKKNGKDGVLTYYRGFTIMTYRYPGGKEILIDIEKSPIVEF